MHGSGQKRGGKAAGKESKPGIPVVYATPKAETAPTDIMPSTPRFKIPARSAYISPSVPNKSGVPATKALLKTLTTSRLSPSIVFAR